MANPCPQYLPSVECFFSSLLHSLHSRQQSSFHSELGPNPSSVRGMFRKKNDRNEVKTFQRKSLKYRLQMKMIRVGVRVATWRWRLVDGWRGSGPDLLSANVFPAGVAACVDGVCLRRCLRAITSSEVIEATCSTPTETRPRAAFGDPNGRVCSHIAKRSIV